MAALSSCLSTKIFTRNSNRTLPPLTLLGRADIGFSPSLIFKKLQVDRFIARSHLAPEAWAGLGKENTATDVSEIQTSKTTHVKFQLQKECMFGDQIFLVGDHPLLGLWNPMDAVPMNWSTGHIWNVELDVPVEITMQFKFVVRKNTGEMEWQPGADRIFKSWESEGTVIITEDWENAEAQKITEEQKPFITGTVSIQREEPMANADSNVMFSATTAYAQEQLNIDGEFFATPKTLENAGNESRVLVPAFMPQQAEVRSEELGSAVSDSSFGVDAAE